MKFRLQILAGVALVPLLCAAPRPALADSPAPSAGPATLTDALVLAYYNNATLQEQRAALREADENVPAALSGWRPTVSVQSAASHYNETQVLSTRLNGQVLGSTKSSLSRDTLINSVNATENVFNGGKTIDSTRQAKNEVYAARAQLLATEQTVFTNVVNSYVAVITDRQLLTLQQSDEQVLEQQLKDTQTQFQVGEITQTDVAQAEASVASSQEQVAVAKGNLAIARENFRQYVSVYPADQLAPPQPLLLPVSDKDAAGQDALLNNPTVVAAQYTNAADKDAVDVAFSALLPSIQLQAQGFYESNPSSADSHVIGSAVTGQLTVPIYQGGSEYAAIRQARAKAQGSFAAILDAQRQSYAQATQAWEGLTSSRAAVVSANAEIKANAVALDGTEREELVGTRTTLDVLNAQQLLLNSQVQQVQNIANLVQYSYAVAAAIGRLTARDLSLPVQAYDDERYYDVVALAPAGTGELADAHAGLNPDGSLANAPLPADMTDAPQTAPAQ
jgi:outer membrane protein